MRRSHATLRPSLENLHQEDLAWFILENDPDELDLDARNNYWYRDDVLQTQQLDIEDRIATEIASDDPDVVITGFYTSAAGTCYPPSAASVNAGCVGGSRVAGGPRPETGANSESEQPRSASNWTTALHRPSPNPFLAVARVTFTVGLDDAGRYRVDVFDVAGRRVTALADGYREPGLHQVEWRGVSEVGTPVSPGVYFVRMTGPRYTRMQKLVLLR